MQNITTAFQNNVKPDLFESSTVSNLPPLNLTNISSTTVSYKNETTIYTTTLVDIAKSTLQKLNIFSFNFIDNTKFQKKMQGILAGNTEEPLSWTSLVTTPTTKLYREVVTESVSYGLIIPILLILCFLMVVGACLLWQSCHDRLRNRNSKVNSFHSFHRSLNGWEEWRNSTRSNKPIQVTTPAKKDYIPRLDKISESPEDKFHASLRRGIVFSPDDSIGTSILSSVRSKYIPTVSAKVPDHLSNDAFYPDTSQSYPNLILGAQAPFSPYRIAYCTPIVCRPVHSDPNILYSSSGPHCMQHAYSLCTSDGTSYPGSYRSNSLVHSWKSPFHPNFNTPTNGSEGEQIIPHDIIINDILSTPDTSPPYQNSRNSFTTSYEMAPLSATAFNSVDTHRSPSLSSSETSSSSSSEGVMSVELSCPSNVGTWKYNDLYNHPDVNANIPTYRVPNAVVDRQQKANGPVQVNYRSNTEHVQGLSEPPSVNTSLVAMVGSTNSSMVGLQMVANSANTSLMAAVGSSNTSVHFDSYNSQSAEQSSCTVTGLYSGHSTSGYIAGPSHSTSINPNSSNNTSRATSTYHSHNNSSSVAPGLSAISIIFSPHNSDSNSFGSVPQLMDATNCHEKSKSGFTKGGFADQSYAWESIASRTIRSYCSDDPSASGHQEVPSSTDTCTSHSTETLSSHSAIQSLSQSLSLELSSRPATPVADNVQTTATPTTTTEASFEWDTYPFYTPPVEQDERGMPPIQHVVKIRWSQPVLSEKQYWV